MHLHFSEQRSKNIKHVSISANEESKAGNEVK